MDARHSPKVQDKVRFFVGLLEEIMKTKVCGRCKNRQPLKNFTKRTKSKDGLNNTCTICKREICRKHYEKNRQRCIDTATIRNNKKLKWWREYKETLSCLICGIKHPAVIVFHHRDPKTKGGQVPHLAAKSKEAALEEIKKCDILCANCHMILHYEERNGY